MRNDGTTAMIMSLLAQSAVIVDHPLFLTPVKADADLQQITERSIDELLESSELCKKNLRKIGRFQKYRLKYISYFYHQIFNVTLGRIETQMPANRLPLCIYVMDRVAPHRRRTP